MSEYTVTIPTKDTMGSRFGSCTCRKPTKDGVPCKHMVDSESIQDQRIESNSDHAVLADKCPLASTICS